MRPFIVIGDRTDHGGVVVGSTMTTETHGKRLARVGDQVTCPKKGHGTTVIVTGDPTMIVDGAPVARHGDKCACGATLIASQVLSRSDDGSSHSVARHGAEARSSAFATWPFSASLASVLPPSDVQQDDLEQYFVIENEEGQPVSDMHYRLDGNGQALHQDGLNSRGATKSFSMNENLNAIFWIPMEART